MSPYRIADPLLAVSLLSSLASATVGFNCKDIVSQGVRWDLGELGGPRVVHWIREIEPAVHDYHFSLDICQPLKKHKDEPSHNECPTNTRVCGVEYITNEETNTTIVNHVAPIAGDYHMEHGQPLESSVYRLKGSGSTSDSTKEGVRVELSGGKDPMNDKKGVKQKAIIEFLCDSERDGKDTEVDDRPTDKDKRKREDGKEGDDDPYKKIIKDDRALRFLSYQTEPVGKDKEEWGVLRLEWRSKYACENAVDAPKEPSEGGWGFFTWLIIILFLATSSYLIFGSWLNYNRYGARGWDALPHGDTLRDLPYIMTDFGRKVTNTIQGSGSRGGYSAV